MSDFPHPNDKPYAVWWKDVDGTYRINSRHVDWSEAHVKAHNDGLRGETGYVTFETIQCAYGYDIAHD